MAALSFVLSLYLRVGPSFGDYDLDFIVVGTAAFTAIAGIVYLWMDLYRGIWRYASLNDLLAIARAVALIILIFLPVMFLATRLADLPRSVVFINWFVLTILLAAPRILYRLLKDGRFDLSFDRAHDQRIKVLLIGAGEGAEMFIQAMSRRTRSEYHAVAILDAAERRIGRHIRGVPVLGIIDDLAAVVAQAARAGHGAAAPGHHEARSRPRPAPPAGRRGRPARPDRGAAAAPDRVPRCRRRRRRGAADRARRPAGPAAERAEPRRHEGAGVGAARAGDRRRRHDRQRAGAPARGDRPGAAGAGRQFRVQPLCDRDGGP